MDKNEVKKYFKTEKNRLAVHEELIMQIFENKLSYREGTDVIFEHFLNNHDDIASAEFFNDALKDYYKGAFNWCNEVHNKISSIHLYSDNYCVVLMERPNAPLEAHIYYEGPFFATYEPTPLNENLLYNSYCAVIDYEDKKISKQEYLRIRFSSVSSVLRRNILFAQNGKVVSKEEALNKKKKMEARYERDLKDYNSKRKSFLDSKIEYDDIVKTLNDVLNAEIKTTVNFVI